MNEKINLVYKRFEKIFKIKKRDNSVIKSIFGSTKKENNFTSFFSLIIQNSILD